MVINNLLRILIHALLAGLISSVSQIRNIVSPKVDYSNNQIGTMSFTFFWTTDFHYAEPSLKDLQLRVVFPMALTAPLKISWIKVADTCIVSSNLVTTTSAASTIGGDVAGAHFFDMVGADYTPGSKYKLIVKIDQTADIPTTLGMTPPIQLSIVSSKEEHFITYAKNSNFGTAFINAAAPGDFEFDLTPSYSDPNIKTFTRAFFGQADVRVYSGDSIAKILIKLDNYVFSDDAESTCDTMPDESKNIIALDRNDFYCEFESGDKKGLFFIWKDTKFVPLDLTFRLKFRVRNPNLPGSTNIKIAMMERYSPKILKFKSIAAGYTCGAADFGLNYPKLFVGPNLDTSSNFFPNVTLYSMMKSADTVVFNSMRLSLRVSTDLPLPNDHYTVFLKIGGNTKTLIPQSLIYHDLPVAPGKSIIKIAIDATTRDITFSNVGSLSSRKSYTIGFKVAFYGDEVLSFFGVNAIGSLEVKDSSGATVITRAAPSGVKSSFKSFNQNVWPYTSDMPTLFHTRKQAETANGDYSGINRNWPNYGLETGDNLQFIFKAEINNNGYVDKQSYIEVITSASITAIAVAADYSDANALTNCDLRRNGGQAHAAGNIQGCHYMHVNKGLTGSEYSRFRMSPQSTNFWAAGERHYIWNNVKVAKHASLFGEDTDATILDTYINVYQDAYTQDISQDFTIGIDKTYLDNLVVRDDSHFTNTKIHFMNYQGRVAAGPYNVLDPKMLPGVLRVGGTFDNINTFDSSKIVLFFYGFEPLVKDIDNPYEVGCSTSANASVRCYYTQGVKETTCDTGPVKTCSTPIMFSRLEILFSSTIISISDTTEVQVAIPIVVDADMPGTITSYIASARSHFGTLSPYPQILSYKSFDLTRPGNLKNNVTPLTAAQVNNDATPHLIRVATTGTSVGDTFDSQFNVFASDGQYNVAPSTDQFYSFTFCSVYNFMQDKSFSTPATGDTYKLCVPNINYQVDNAGTKEERHCLFCPMWTDGDDSVFLSFSKMYVSPSYGMNWPTGTYAGLSGIRQTQQLQSIVDQTLITNAGDPTKFATNFITNFSVEPNVLYFDNTQGSLEQRSIKLAFKFTTPNKIPSGGTLVFKAAPGFTLPFSFKNNPSNFCYIENAQGKYACSITNTPNTEFQLVLAQEMSKGPFVLTIYGINTRLGGVTMPFVFKIDLTTYIAGGTTDIFRIDVQSASAEITLQQYQEAAVDARLNVLKNTNLDMETKNPGTKTTLSMDIQLGNNKNFYENDRLWIDLQDGAYTTTTTTPKKPVQCEIIDSATKKIITGFKTCNTLDLAGIELVSSRDTGYNAFTLRISSFVNPLAFTNNPVSEIRFVDDNAFKNQLLNMPDQAVWPAVTTPVSLNLFTISKKIDFFGLRTEIEVQVRSQSTAISYQSRLYLKFPFHYDPNLGSFPVSCYLDTGSGLQKLYCWMFEERELAISGFRTDFAALDLLKIRIFGVEQPEFTDTDSFYIGLDNDDDPSAYNEAAFFSYPTVAQAVPPTIEIAEIIHAEYSHRFIRAQNTYLFQMKSAINIASGSFIYVYIDHLDFEYENVSETGNCIVQATPTSPSISSKCIREGNRYQIELNAIFTLNTEYTILIKGIPTPDFTICNAKKPSIYVTDSSNVLLLISTDFYQNSAMTSFRQESSQIYLDFKGLTSSQNIKIIKGVYNEIKVKREDGERLNDDFTFKLLNTENDIFAQLETSKMALYDSVIGLEDYPIFISSSMNSFTNVIPVQIGNTPRFQVSLFSKLPSLRVELTQDKATLKIPSLIAFTSRGSLPFYVELKQIPIADIAFTVTFEGTTLLSCTPSTFTLSETVRRIKLQITSTHPAGPSVETPSIVITPTGTTGYGVTKAPVVLQPFTAPGAQTKNTITEASTQQYDINVDFNGPKPASFYYIAIPSTLHRNFTKDYVVKKFEENQLTDHYYHIGYSSAPGTQVLEIPIFEDLLTSNKVYNFTFYLTDFDGENEEIRLNSQTRDSPGGFGYFNITFASEIADKTKPDLVCNLAQLLSYPLENLQTSDGFRCPSSYITPVEDQLEMDPAVLPARRRIRRNLQMEVIDATNGVSKQENKDAHTSHTVQILTLKNLKPYHDTTAYSKVQAIIINNNFYAQLGDKLKDFPQVEHRTPLISLQFFKQELERETKIYNLKGNRTIQLTEMKALRKGYIYCMILYKNEEMQKLIIPEHVKMGIDAKNVASIWKKQYFVENPEEIFYFNIEELPFETNTTETGQYTFYYVATDERITPWGEHSKIKTIDFTLFRDLSSAAKIIKVFGIAVAVVLGILVLGE